MKQISFYFALIGWLLGLMVHLSTFADIDIAEKFPFIWLLHVGCIIVWLPVVLDLRNNSAELEKFRQLDIRSQLKPNAFFKGVFKDTPNWLSSIAGLGFVYATINFILFAIQQHGTPAFQNGIYVLQNHGHIIKTITEQEYHYGRARELRGFSGHWMLFYGMATAVLYKYSGFKINKVTVN